MERRWYRNPPRCSIPALRFCPYGRAPNQAFYRRARSSPEISAPIQRKEAAGFCAPAFDTLELMASSALCTGLNPSGRADPEIFRRELRKWLSPQPIAA